MKPKTVSSNTIYKDTHIHVKKDVLKRDNFSWNQVYLEWNNKNAVCVIPYEKEGVYLIKQYRHASKKYMWQFPGGIKEKGISDKQMAKRELREETGFAAKNIEKIGSFFPEPGLTSVEIKVYIAKQLQKKTKILEKSEEGIKLMFFPLLEMAQMVKKGQIQCGITLSSYLLLLNHLQT